MPRRLQKSVALAPIDTSNDPLVAPASDVRRSDVRSFLSADPSGAGASWVRVWADWLDLQETGPATLRVDLVDALAENIALARQAGKRVMLTSRSYPLWSNGMAGIPETEASLGFDAAAPGWRATVEDRRRRPGSRLKLRRFRFPGDAAAGPRSMDVGPDSAWARWITFLAAYFNADRTAARDLPEPYRTLLRGLDRRPDAWIDALEFVNEPNGPEMWPQRDAQGGFVAADVVAEMFRTAQGIQRSFRATPAPLFVGPATSDALGTSDRMLTSVDDFTRAVLHHLRAIGVAPGKGFAWSHHNYTDITKACWRMPTDGRAPTLLDGRKHPRTNRTQLVRQLLEIEGWAGWPKGRAGDPRLLLTEGGVQREKLTARPGVALEKQHERLLADALRRLRDERGFGRGVDMVTHFLLYTTASFDSGLVELPAAPGLPTPEALERLKRRAYHAWRAAPETRD